MEAQAILKINFLPLEIQHLIFNFLNTADLCKQSGMVALRAANQYFYHAINTYWENIYAIQQVVCGANNSYILLKNGDLYNCGEANQNYLDNNHNVIKPNLVFLDKANNLARNAKFILVMQNVKKVLIGMDIIVALTYENHLYGMGNSHHLGLNKLQSKLEYSGHGLKGVYFFQNKQQECIYGQRYDYSYIKRFQRIAANIKIQDVAVGPRHILLLDNQGKVYSCGFNLYGQLAIGNDKNLDEFTEIFEGADRILATDLNSFILVNNMWYAAGANPNNNISKNISEHELITTMTPITYIFNPNNVKKIINMLGLLCLYNDGKLYMLSSKSPPKLLGVDIADVWYINETFRKVIFLQKQDGLLLYLGDPKCDWLFPTNNYWSLKFKFIIVCWGMKFLQRDCYNRLMLMLANNCTSLIARQVSAGSGYGIVLHKSKNDLDGRTVYTRGLHLMFAADGGKSLYAAGVGCLNGQLGLNTANTKGIQEVFENLPIKNKLLQGKAIKNTVN